MFNALTSFLLHIPGIESPVSTGNTESGCWWVKFSIDIDHTLAWHVVQELGHVLNYLSLDDRLPTLFMPVSPPPYMNGGPDEFLSWVIECRDADFTPDTCAKWLEGRLPKPVDEESAWLDDEEEV